MYSLEVYYAVMKERQRMTQERQKQRALIAAVRQKQDAINMRRKIAGWLGARLVSWGSKLQGLDVPVSPNQVAIHTK